MEYFPDSHSEDELDEGGTFNLDGDLILFPAMYGRRINNGYDIDLTIMDSRKLKSSELMFAEIYDYYKYKSGRCKFWRRKILEAEVIYFNKEDGKWYDLENGPNDMLYHKDEPFTWPPKVNKMKDFGVSMENFENGLMSKHSAVQIVFTPPCPD